MQGAKHLLPHLRDDRWLLLKHAMAVWSCQLQSSLRQPLGRSVQYQLWLGGVSQSDLFLNLAMEKSSEKVKDTGDTVASLAPALARWVQVSLANKYVLKNGWEKVSYLDSGKISYLTNQLWKNTWVLSIFGKIIAILCNQFLKWRWYQKFNAHN